MFDYLKLQPPLQHHTSGSCGTVTLSDSVNVYSVNILNVYSDTYAIISEWINVDIFCFPNEIYCLELFEEFALLENVKEESSGCVAVRILKLQSNKLKLLPYELADAVSLEDIDVSNNEYLNVIPRAWAGDTLSLLFVIRV